MAGRIYNKLDTFLKKNVDADTFERIRHRDACIVCSQKEDKAFKFVILSDEWIYLTENPPITISEEVHLKDILSVRLIVKKPEFLQGEEQNRVQHIEIIHEVHPELTKSKKSTKKNGSSSTRSMISSSRSDTALMAMRSDNSRHVHFTRNTSLDDLQINKKKQLSKRKKIKSAKRGDSIEEDVQAGLSLYLPNSESQEDLKESEVPLSSSRSTSSLKNFFSFKKQPSVEDELARTGIPVYAGGDIIFVQEDEEDVPEQKETQVFNVYILDNYSPFMRYVNGAIENHVIERTLNMDPKVASRKELCLYNASIKTPRGTSGAEKYEKLELLYNQLRTELLNPSNTIFDHFRLVRELKNAVEKIYFLKKLFWKTSEVWNFLLNELKHYIPVSSTAILDLDIAERAKRADELEYATLICETLKGVLRGTEIIQSRAKILLGGGAKKLTELLLVLSSLPEVPGGYDDAYFTLDVRQTNGNSIKQSKPKRALHNAALLNIVDGFVENSIAVLFEIFSFAHQALDDYPDFTTEWCSRVFEGTDYTGELLVGPFLEVVLIHLLGTFAPTAENDSVLTPKEHVDLYYTLYVLCEVVRASEILLKELRDKFYEEFKYYISPFLVKKRTCKDYLLHSRIMDCFTQLVSTILDKNVQFS